MAEKNSYDIVCNCTNCGVQNWLEIPKGTLKQDFQKAFVCINCGCKILIDQPATALAGAAAL